MQDPQRLSEDCLEGGVLDMNFRTVGIREAVRLETGVD